MAANVALLGKLCKSECAQAYKCLAPTIAQVDMAPGDDDVDAAIKAKEPLTSPQQHYQQKYAIVV
eukprot:2899085-Amphidinium_carterae.1